MSKIITGTNAADKITVQETGVVVNAGAGNDIITVNSKSSKSTINAQTGNDNVTVNGGTGNTILTGTGDDTIIIKGGSNNVVSGNQDKDTITVSGGSNNKIYGGSGQDTIIITATIGTGNKIYGEADSDTIEVNGGEKNYINGGGSIDTIKIADGSYNEIYCERENDIITISGGSNNKICGGAENDKITVAKGIGTGNDIYGDAGADTITIGSGKENTVHGGTGNDNVIVNGGSGNIIYGEKGNDTITVNAGENILNGGTGNDTYVINKEISSNETLLIDQSTASKNDADVLKLTEYSVNDFAFYEDVINTNNLILQASDDTQIKINDWKNHPLSKIVFGDSSLTKAQLNNKTKKSKTFEITKGGTYKATSGQDLFNIKTNDIVTITNMASNDIIKGVSYNAYSMRQIGNDLIINEKVIVKDYYKLSGSIKFGDKALTLIPGTDGRSVLTGTSGNDIIFGNVATKSVYAYDGNDEIVAGHNQIVFAGNGNDIIISNEPGTNVLYGGNGNDSINVSSSGENYMYGGNNNDVIVVSGNGSYYMYGGEGNDTLKATTNSGSYYMYGGNGKDKYIPYLGDIYSKSYSGGSIIIKNAETTFTDEEFANLEDEEGNGYNSYKNVNSDCEDTLVINNYNIDDFTFKLDKFDLIISSKYDFYSTDSKAYANELIRIKDWYVHPLENIQFKDKTYTADEINNYMASTYYHWVDGTKDFTLKGDKIRDVFLIKSLPQELSFSELKKSDVLDFSYADDVSLVYARSNNDMKIISNRQNVITVKNFFNSNQDIYIYKKTGIMKLIDAFNSNLKARANDGYYYVSEWNNKYKSIIYAGDGNDTICVSLNDGTPKDIYGEGGDDIITLEDWRKYDSDRDRNLSDIYLNGGSGNDNFIMNNDYGIYFFNSSNAVVIDERSKASDEVDTLEIDYRYSTRFQFALDDSGDLIISEKEYANEHVSYHILGGNVLDKVYFKADNVTYTKEDIASMLNTSSVSSAMLSFSNSSVSSSANIGNDLFQQNKDSNLIVTGNI